MTAWIAACQRPLAGAARQRLSAAFVRHIGLEAGAFVAQERGLYRQAPKGLGVRIVDVCPAAPETATAAAAAARPEGSTREASTREASTREGVTPGGATRVRYRVLAPDGWLLFESTQVLDAAGLIQGNGSAFDVVPKLAFTAEGVRLGLAIRSTLGALKAVVPTSGGPVLTEVAHFPACGPPEQRYDTIRLTVAGIGQTPPAESLSVRLKVLAAQGRETVSIQFPGADHPFFRPGLFPTLHGASVDLPAYPGRYWSLAVDLADGRQRQVPQPRPGRHRFPAPVVAATLTDALDLDWVTGPS